MQCEQFPIIWNAEVALPPILEKKGFENRLNDVYGMFSYFKGSLKKQFNSQEKEFYNSPFSILTNFIYGFVLVLKTLAKKYLFSVLYIKSHSLCENLSGTLSP